MNTTKSTLVSAAVALILTQAAPVLAAEGKIEEVVVTGIRGSLRQSLETKRESVAIVDAITAEDVGKFPDKNVAEALQRVPGIVINREFGEGERVSLRGTAPNLTRTLLNGHALATADWFILEQLAATRSFNYLMLPSDIIGQVAVYKTPQADFEEGGIGGTINVVTRNPLDLEPFTAYGAVQGAYTDLADEFDPQGTGLVSWKNSDNTFGVLVAAVYQERNIRRDGVEVLGYFDNNPASNAELLVPSLIGSALFQQERIRKGGNFGVQWRPSDALEFNLTGLYSKFDADNLNENYLAWGSNALGGGGTLSNATIVGNTVVAGRIASTANGRGAVYDAIDRFASAETRSIDLDTSVTPNDAWNLHFRIGYTDAEGNTESQPFVEFGAPATFDFDLRGSAPQVRFLNLDPNDPTDMVFDFASLHQITNDDDEFYTYADAETPLELGVLHSLKFGLKYTDHDRETQFLATTFGGFFLPLSANGCGGPCDPIDFAGPPTPGDFLDEIAAGGTLGSYWQVNRSAVERFLFGVPGALANRIPNPPENFSINEKTYAGYAMANLGGDGWRGNIGARLVRTEQTSSGNVSGSAGPGSISNAFGNFTPVTFERTYNDVLPSVNLSFDLTDDMLLRFAAARTMARPDYTDIVPRVSLNPGALTGTGGNPEVDPYRANQFDVSFEWYFDADAAVALAFYYKDILSFITDSPTTGIFPVETATPNLSLCTSAGTSNPNLYNCQFTINQRSNGGGGRIQGFELAGTLPIGAGFGIQANYTYSDGEANNGDPIPGNSQDAFNIVGYFENQLLSARLAYTYRSDFFVTFDRSTQLNQKALASLDASLVVNVTPSLAVTLDAVNLTNETIEQFATEEFRPRAIYDNGRIYYGGVRLKF